MPIFPSVEQDAKETGCQHLPEYGPGTGVNVGVGSPTKQNQEDHGEQDCLGRSNHFPHPLCPVQRLAVSPSFLLLIHILLHMQ